MNDVESKPEGATKPEAAKPEGAPEGPGGAAIGPAGETLEAKGAPAPGAGSEADAKADKALQTAADKQAEAPPSVVLEDIVQRFPQPDGGTVEVVSGVTLRLEQPGINMLLGPSGCGKSTLLKMMGGVRPFGIKSPSSGQVLINGQVCEGAHDDSVMVFQRYSNRPDLTIRENVAFPFRLGLWKRRVPAAERTKRVDAMLEAVGLADKAELRPA
jgi:ABC-type glutathione transport system ATPase component